MDAALCIQHTGGRHYLFAHYLFVGLTLETFTGRGAARREVNDLSGSTLTLSLCYWACSSCVFVVSEAEKICLM